MNDVTTTPRPLFARLLEAGSTGLDLSPGDPLAKEAHDELLLASSHLRGLVFHWNEFGPADGYDELVHYAHGWLKKHDATAGGYADEPTVVMRLQAALEGIVKLEGKPLTIAQDLARGALAAHVAAQQNFNAPPAPCAHSVVSGEHRQSGDIRSAGPEAQSSERRGSSEQPGVTARRDGNFPWPRDPKDPSPRVDVTWPTAKGDPIYPVWRYNGRTGMYESQALRMMAHDLVDRIKELELPVRKAMKQAGGDGLDPIAYANMMHKRIEGTQRENARLREDVARYENGRVVLADELDRIRAALNEERQRADDLSYRLHAATSGLPVHVSKSDGQHWIYFTSEPDGWIRYMRHAAGGPDPEEVIMYEFASRSEPHEGEGWVPLYSRPGAEPSTGPLKLDTDSQVFFYEQDHYYLSNFSAFRLAIVVPDNDFGGERTMHFDTSEVAYHWFKFEGQPEIQGLILQARSSHEAFKLAEKWREHRRWDWEHVKVDVMRQILRAKVQQHEYVRRKLLETGDRELVENSWRDDVWGWGPNRDGQNMLGKLWMEIRAELRAAETPTPICDAPLCCLAKGHEGEHDDIAF